MVDILHRIAVKDVPAEAVFDAVATREGIASWWIGSTTGSADLGGTLAFGDDIKGEVIERSRERVVWQFVAGSDEWIGTRAIFEIKRDEPYTVMLFTHQGWAEPKEFMHHCSTKWGVFMLSLKKLLEDGVGTPTPNDPHIDNWA